MDRYKSVRAFTEKLCEPLSAEDHCIQGMADASPPKWHLAHTTWFFETFVLLPNLPGYRVFNDTFSYLFNSYYETVGARHARPERGVLSRPALSEVTAWRAHVDAAVMKLDGGALISLGLHHEQQHQELILTDIKYSFSRNALDPVYLERSPDPSAPAAGPLGFVDFDGGLVEVGHSGEGFSFDNERPRHRCWLEPFSLARRPVTVGEYRAFIDDGGYQQPRWWMSDGWAWLRQQDIQAPLYWRLEHDDHFTLAGRQPLHPNEILTHVSWYEADAYAAWAGARLPTELEWEHAFAQEVPDDSHNFAQSGRFHPGIADAGGATPAHGLGDVWEWTGSAYLPYPGYRRPEGAVGEYNAKFMNGQFVLRGGSCATSQSHIRPTYRNFFYPTQRWQFTGIRLAKDLNEEHR